jgi:hypothetical protein
VSESVLSGTRALTAGYRFLRWALIQWRTREERHEVAARSGLGPSLYSSPGFDGLHRPDAYSILTILLERVCLEAGVARLSAAAVSNTQSGGDSRQGEIFHAIDFFCHGNST